MLNSHPFTRPEIRDFCRIHSRTLQEKPPHMSEEKSSLDTIGIFHGICFGMVYTVIVRPCRSRTSKSETAEKEIYDFYNWMCLVCTV